MTIVTIPNRPAPGATRDINQILANFDAITTVINGNLDSGNLTNKAITGVKIADATIGSQQIAIGGVSLANIAATAGVVATPDFLAHMQFRTINTTTPGLPLGAQYVSVGFTPFPSGVVLAMVIPRPLGNGSSVGNWSNADFGNGSVGMYLGNNLVQDYQWIGFALGY